MEELLISTAANIHKINANGVKKISRNILALQQCVKTIARDPRDAEFERAKQYWALHTLNPAVRSLGTLIRLFLNVWA
jgi:exocyst complex component 4